MKKDIFLGQEFIFKKIASSLDSNILLWGPKNSGKKFFAKNLAKFFLCQNPTKDLSPCNSCKSCEYFEKNIHPDFSYLEISENETSMEFLREKSSIYEHSVRNSILSKKSVILFPDIDKISVDGQNYLLKFFEDMKSGTTIIATTSQKTKIIKTVQSRFSQIFVGQIPLSKFLEISNSEKEYFENFGLIGRYFSKKKENFPDEFDFAKYIEIIKSDRTKATKFLNFLANKFLLEKKFDLILKILEILDFISSNGNLSIASAYISKEIFLKK